MMPFECLGPLPALEELHIHCNMIKKISSVKGFPRLEILDLSYNKNHKRFSVKAHENYRFCEFWI